MKSEIQRAKMAYKLTKSCRYLLVMDELTRLVED